MSTSLLPTAVDLVFSTRNTASLVETFLSCPTAAKLLDSGPFIKPMVIKSSNFQSPTTRWTSRTAIISIPEKELRRTEEALDSLAFEIFNAQPLHESTAPNPQMGMDSYVRQIEEVEYSRTLPSYKLLIQCAEVWRLSSEHVKEVTDFANRDPEFVSFLQEYRCHTDDYRRQWIEEHQNVYCKKRPEDTRSCKAKKKDFCDLNEMKKLSPSKQEKFLNARICTLFPQAHETVKNDPYIRMKIKENCPTVLRRDL